MMEVLGYIVIVLGLGGVFVLCLFFAWKAGQLMDEEAARAELRRQTANAMRTDKHLAKLRRNKMHAQYVRRARVW